LTKKGRRKRQKEKKRKKENPEKFNPPHSAAFPFDVVLVNTPVPQKSEVEQPAGFTYGPRGKVNMW
jgi:hypothetical protein